MWSLHYQVTKWIEKTRPNQPILWHCHDSLCFYQNKTWSPPGYARLVCQDKTCSGCSVLLWWLVQGRLIAFLFPSHCFITLLALPLSGSYVRVGNRFRSQVQDNKESRWYQKNPFSIHIWTSSAYGATDPPGYWVANGRDEERFCLNVTFTGLTIYLERRGRMKPGGKRHWIPSYFGKVEDALTFYREICWRMILRIMMSRVRHPPSPCV